MALTPGKGKKALPLSTSLLFFEQPCQQSDQLVGFDSVRVQYWSGHWKECASLCHELLNDVPRPSANIRATCLHFYAAVCYDSIGRTLNDFSTEKLRYLERAGQSYIAAAALLPSREEEVWREEWNDQATMRSSMFIKQYDHQTPTKSGSPQHNIFSQFTPIPQRRFARESIGALIPSPLHLSEDPGSEELPSTPPTSKSAGLLSNIFRNSQGYLPFTPPKNIIPSSPSSSVRRRSITFSASSYQWSQRRSAERYNEHLADFAKMLQGHITTVEELISTVKNFQADRRVKRFASLRDDKETRAADLGARILRLRAKGWKRERFVPEKYQELCAKALAEL